MQALSPLAYALRLVMTLASVLLVVWLYVVAAPLAFMPSGYPSWLAKMTLLRACQPAVIGFFGDSRIEAGIIPAALPVPAINIGVAGGTPIEVEAGIHRLLHCPSKPQLVVIALGMGSFGPVGQGFWIETLGYGFLPPAELWQLEYQARIINDTVTLDTKTQDGLSGPIRDWLYALRFPSLSFGNLAQGQVFRRLDSNTARFADILHRLGFVPYPILPPTDKVGPEATLTSFVTTGLQVASFERALAALQDRSIPVALLLMPIKQSTRTAMSPAVADAYLDYLRSLAARFSNVSLIGDHIPGWPTALFTDDVHLNPRGAERLTSRLAVCLEGGSLRADCDLDWDAGVSQAHRASEVN